MTMESLAETNQKRKAALVVVWLSAAISLGLMFWVGRHNPSVLLVMMFTFWVASPFVGMLFMHHVAQDWGTNRQISTYGQILFISLASIAVYAAVVFLMHLKKPAGPFLAVPAVTWLIIAVLLWVSNFKERAVRK